MACTSGSVQKVVDKTEAAKKQIENLQKMIEGQDNEFKSKFYKKINEHLKDSNITDAKEISYESNIKTEYTSEFCLDKIAAVVKSALNAAVATQTLPNAVINSAAIDAYTDVVNAVVEAAKSSSIASANLSFSMIRFSPGFLAFLSAHSVSIFDKNTFGSEAVTTTAIYYRTMQSIDDLRSATLFNEALIDSKNLLNMKAVQAAITDELANGKIDIETWLKKDAAYAEAIKRIQARLDKHDLRTIHIRESLIEPENDRCYEHVERKRVSKKSTFIKPESHLSESNLELISNSVNKLSEMGEEYKIAVERTTKRITEGYY